MKQLFTFIFVLFGLTVFSQVDYIDSSDPAQSIDRRYDDFKDETQFRTPILKPVVLTKVLKGNKATFYIGFTANGSYLAGVRQGVYVLFTDRTRWNKILQKVDYDPNRNRLQYSAFFEITRSELRMLKEKQILKTRLMVFDTEVNEADSKLFQKQAALMETLK